MRGKSTSGPRREPAIPASVPPAPPSSRSEVKSTRYISALLSPGHASSVVGGVSSACGEWVTTGWSTGGRKSAGASGLRRHGINLIMLGAFALVASGAASVVNSADLPMDMLMLIGFVMCLAGWRMLVVARRREHSSD
jgi:hypothetical protein